MTLKQWVNLLFGALVLGGIAALAGLSVFVWLAIR